VADRSQRGVEDDNPAGVFVPCANVVHANSIVEGKARRQLPLVLRAIARRGMFDDQHEALPSVKIFDAAL